MYIKLSYKHGHDVTITRRMYYHYYIILSLCVFVSEPVNNLVYFVFVLDIQ